MIQLAELPGVPTSHLRYGHLTILACSALYLVFGRSASRGNGPGIFAGLGLLIHASQHPELGENGLCTFVCPFFSCVRMGLVESLQEMGEKD